MSRKLKGLGSLVGYRFLSRRWIEKCVSSSKDDGGNNAFFTFCDDEQVEQAEQAEQAEEQVRTMH